MIRAIAPAALFASILAIPANAEPADEDPFGLNDKPAIEIADASVADLAAATRDSLVVITQSGRDGATAGTGTGFVISADGLIATCAHVIGESRPISVRFESGDEHEVTAIHAWDRKLDLAVLQIDKKGLKPLALAPAESLKQGAEVVAMGNPHGLEFSIVRGVVSALRTIAEQPLIQVAIPIEPGNSGGPLIDMEGSVHGLLTMKSAFTDNLGFAVPVADLHRLLEKPNTVKIDKWLTIGQLDPKRWKALMGARWKQRAGRITVARPGVGFGGRSLCVSQREVPKPPYEIAVEVKLDDEAGAAGLIFASDGADKHYGFYPSAGNLRLTRFEGPDVLSWSILDQQESPAYRPGEWNRIRVRVGEKKITAFVNGSKVVELNDGVLRGGKVGLAKFRSTEAEFRKFRIGTDLATKPSPPETVAAMNALIDALAASPDDPKAIAGISAEPELGRRLIQRKIKALLASAARLEDGADLVHRSAIQRELTTEFEKEEGADLLRCALLLAEHDNPEIDTEAYTDEVARMAGEIESTVPKNSDPATIVAAIGKYLFADNGYHGSRSDYYNRSNSYLNEVIDDREGIPITLAVLFIELAERLDLKLHGLGLPGHFVAYYADGKGRQIIDPFEGGKPLTPAEADEIVRAFGGGGKSADYSAADTKAIIQRMVFNLKAVAIDAKDYAGALRYVDLLLAIDPKDGGERLSRALLHVQTDQGEKAKLDLEWLFEHKPEGIHLDRLRGLYDRL